LLSTAENTVHRLEQSKILEDFRGYLVLVGLGSRSGIAKTTAQVLHRPLNLVEYRKRNGWEGQFNRRLITHDPERSTPPLVGPIQTDYIRMNLVSDVNHIK
jgi:uncharacterized protein YfdQ (DUF2303 family)